MGHLKYYCKTNNRYEIDIHHHNQYMRFIQNMEYHS